MRGTSSIAAKIERLAKLSVVIVRAGGRSSRQRTCRFALLFSIRHALITGCPAFAGHDVVLDGAFRLILAPIGTSPRITISTFSYNALIQFPNIFLLMIKRITSLVPSRI